MTDDVERVEDIRLVTGPAAERLNERQLVDYRSERWDCIEWPTGGRSGLAAVSEGLLAR